MRARTPSASATARSTSARTTSTARCWTRSCSTPGAASGCPGGCGRSCSPRRRGRRASGASPTRGSGRRGERRSTTCPPSSCAGSRWTARPSSPASGALPTSRRRGLRSPRRSATDILEHGVDDRGVLRQHYDTDALDASTLLAALFGFLPGDDPRLRASVLAIADELTEDGFVLRYRTGETDDGLSGKEGTFLICSFWLVSALAIIGETGRARDLMERLLREASPLGLYAEEFEVATSRHLGNFPQAFSHLALIEAAGTDHPRRATGGALMTSYDVIVIGSGAGGGTLVRHLASSGKRILLLERGDWLRARAGQLVGPRRVRRQPLRHPGHLVRRPRQAVPAAGPLLRRRRDEALRRGAVPAAREGLRRAAPPRRRLARVADLLRRARAVLHAGRAALPRARRTGGGPDRAAEQRSVPVSRGQPRAAHPAALRRSRGARAATRSTRRAA